MIHKANAYRIFQAFWVYFLVLNIAELNLNIPFLHVSVILFIKYTPFVIAAFVLIPFREFTGIFKDRVFLFKIIPLFVLIVIAFISSNYAQFPETAFSTSRRMAFYTCILIICVSASRYFEEAPDFFIRTFIYSNVLVILGSFLDFYVPQFHVLLVDSFGRPETYHSTMSIGSEKIMRPMGFLTDSNLTAFSIAISLGLLLVNYKNFGRIFRYSFFALGSYIFGMLVSRASLLVCILTVIVFFSFKIVEKKEIYIFTVLFVFFQLITPQTYVRIASFFDKSRFKSEVSYGRLTIWEASFGLFKENMVIGAGPGNFFEVSQQRIRDVLLSQNPNINLDNPFLKSYHKIDRVNPHNIFLVMLSETGLMGFSVFLALIGLLIYIYIKERKYISLLFLLNIIFVSSLSNFAPHYKFYLIICIVYFIASNKDMKISSVSSEANQ